MSDTITSLADNLQRLADVTDAIGDTITEMGGTVGQYDRLEQYPDDILTIPTNVGEQTVTDTNTVKFISNGDNLIDCNLKGNMVQTGTPSPTNIIIPSEVGDKTANLFDGTYLNSYITSRGVYVTPDDNAKSIIIPCEGNTTYTIKQYISDTSHKFRIATFTEYPINYSQGFLIVADDSLYEYTFTTGDNDKYIVYFCVYPYSTPQDLSIMVNIGDTALPYEPYGYKISVLCGGITTNKYLSEVQSTRQIKKTVLTGNDAWKISSTTVYVDNNDAVKQSALVCTHFVNSSSGMWNGNNWKWQVDIANYGMSTLAEWITYLQQQYSAGTPVCVWYVLATPQTTTLNEPIRKIGNYADSISVSNLPTIEGLNTLIINTQLNPSEIYIKYRYEEYIPKLNTKTITTDGTYNASTDNLDGYSTVIVDYDTSSINNILESVNDSLETSIGSNS